VAESLRKYDVKISVVDPVGLGAPPSIAVPDDLRSW